MSDLETQPAVGAVIAGRYRVLREIGRGGMAVVYLAQDLKLDRQVAIKTLDGELTGPVGSLRFQREIQVLTRLSHPHILSVDDCGEFEGRLFYVMPYIAGETLDKRIDREGQLPVADALHIARDVAAALDHAHRVHIVHRDIKPSNILLHDGEALVADFGVAHVVGAGLDEKLTATGLALGTPMYMSPEQATVDRHLDGRADLYSLGCVLYEMLAGQPPFTGSSAQVIMARHMMDRVPPLTIARPELPQEVEDLVMRCLAKSPADRFASAAELCGVLSDLLAHPRSPSGARTAAPASRSRTARRALIVGVAALAVIALVVALRRASTSGRGAALDPNHIAVLYFEDRSPDGSLRFFADGLTEALIDQLASVRQLTVISRNGVAPFRGATVSLDSIARAFRVGTVVTGSIQESADRLRVSVALADAATGAQLDARTLDRPRTDFLQLQDDLADQVSLALRRALGGEIERRGGARGTRNVVAWEAFQRNKGTIASVDDLVAAGDVKAAMRRIDVADSELAAIQTMDRTWAAPLAARAQLDIRRTLTVGFGEPARIPAWLAHASLLSDSAVSLDRASADALEAHGVSRYFKYMFQVAPDTATRAAQRDSAERDFKAAVGANPLQATAWNALSHLYASKSRNAESRLAARNAYDSDPYAANVGRTLWMLFSSSVDLDDRAEAQKWCDLGRQREPRNFRFAECRLLLLGMPGSMPGVDSVWAAYHEFIRLSPAGRHVVDSLKAGQYAAVALARARLADSARAVAARSRADETIDPAGDVLRLEREVYRVLGDSAGVAEMNRRYDEHLARQRARAKRG